MAVSIKYSIIFFTSALLLQGALAGIICEDLSTNVCAFAIASSGKRCLLENTAGNNGKVEFQCKTSDVVVSKIKDHIESDECVEACGVDRNSVGFSSDNLLEPHFAAKLCSPACFQHCANIVDLYYNLAAGEGVYLPDICHKELTGSHRAMIELSSSGKAAAAPSPKA